MRTTIDMLAGLRLRSFLPSLLFGAWLGPPGAASAQSADPVAPFLGTWSGVFTTQDNDYWGAEDLLCFPGCSLELYKNVVALLGDPKNKEKSFRELVGPATAAEHAGHSGELKGVERYTVHENPKRLEVELTLEDPVTLTKPYVLTKTWLYTPDVKLLQDSCSEFPGKY